MATGETQSTHLIVNADDYGYFDCVSRGILEAFQHGIVTATGVFANSACFDEHVAWLADYPDLDLGVHLNITERAPLTESMRQKLIDSAGLFPGKYGVAKAILVGAITREAVMGEWRAQIERCLDSGLKIRFLNSHEHIHMLPPLFSIVQTLAREYAIPHVRFSTPERSRIITPGALVRDTVLTLLAAYNRYRSNDPAADFLGMGVSGRLDASYLARKLTGLKPGRVYELMCHPGRCDDNQVQDSRLLSYHDWIGELASLTDPEVKELLRRLDIQLIGYRELQIRTGQFVVRKNDATH